MLKITTHERFFLPLLRLLHVNMVHVAMIIAIVILQLVIISGPHHLVCSFTSSLQYPSTTTTTTTRIMNTAFKINARERNIIRNRSTTSLEGIRGFRAWVCVNI